MNELLSHPAVQAALVVAIVTGLNAIVAWLKQKFPTQAASVESNWCYLQPAVTSAMAAAQASMAKPEFGSSVVSGIVMRAMTEFADSYRKLEGKQPTTTEVEAARKEIENAVSRVTGG